jgi:serine/threonine-protein kinase
MDVLVGGSGTDGPFAKGVVLESRYRIDTEVGRGGMGIVYRGTDLTLKRPVAIKALRQSDADNNVLSRFLREARSLARVEHPGLVPVYAVGREDGTYYMVMKFVEGETLQTFIKRNVTVEARVVRRILRETCDALGALHRHGLIHRDLKPSNIILGTEGRVIVMDLGIVKAVGENTQTTSTALGTPKYMAPETLTESQVDARADLYSIGVIGYEMVTGDPPFDGPTPMAILYKQAHEAPEPLRKRAPNAPKNLAGAIERALAKDPAQRFESAAQMAEALEEGAAAPAPSRSQDRRVMAAAGVGLLAALGAVFAFSGSDAPKSTETVPARSTTKDTPPTAPPTAPPVSQPATLPSAPPPSAAPPTAASTTPAVPSGPAVRLVTLRITSDPPGAQVLERGTPLGRTPLVFRRPAAQRVLALQLKREGYGDKQVTLNLGNDAQAHARLEALFELVP